MGDELFTPSMLENGTASFLSYNNETDYGPPIPEHVIMFYFRLYNISIPTVFAIFTLVGVVGNALVIYVILSSPTMRTTTNILLLNLAVADISFLIICVPSTAVKYSADTWPLGDAMCKMINYFLFVTAYVTVYTLVAVSLLRYLTIVHSHRTARYRNKQNMIIVTVLVWLVGVFANIPVLLIHAEKRYGVYAYCGMTDPKLGKPLYIVFFVIGYVLPLSMICILYFSILGHLKEAQRASSIVDKAGRNDRTGKATRIILSVVIIFGVCWLPLHVDLMWSYLGRAPKTGESKFYEVLRVIWKCMAYSNSCVNPFIYNYVSRDFRDKFREILCCGHRCVPRRKASNGYQTTATDMTEMNEV